MDSIGFARLGRFGIAALTIASLATVGCGGEKSKDDASGDASSKTQPAGERAEAASVDPGAPFAVINGTELYHRDLERVLSNLKRQNVPPNENVEGSTPEERLRNTAQKLLIDQTLVIQAAEKAGYTVDDGEVQTRLSQIKVSAGGDSNFVAWLETLGVSEDEVRRDLRSNLLIRKYFAEKVDQNPEVTDAETKAFFDENQDRFGPQPEVHAQHILLRTTDGDDMAEADTRAKGEQILRELKGGLDFGEAAGKYSEDETNNKSGGDLGWFGKGRMVAPFDSAAFALDVGELSGLIKTRFGYHIIRLEEKRMSPGRSYDEIKDGLQGLVRQKKVADASEAMVDSLREQADIKIL